MRYTKLRNDDLRHRMADLFATLGTWFPRNKDDHNAMWLKLQREIRRRKSSYWVAIDDCAGDKLVGVIGYQTELPLCESGVPNITITDLHVDPDYYGTNVKAELMGKAVQAAIANGAHYLDAKVPIEDRTFFETQLFSEPSSDVWMRRTLPNSRWTKMRKNPVKGLE